MLCRNQLRAIVMSLFMLVSPGSLAFSDVIVEGQIDLLPESPVRPGDPPPDAASTSLRTITEVDHVYFRVNTAGSITFDALSAEYDPVAEVPVDLNHVRKFAFLRVIGLELQRGGTVRVISPTQVFFRRRRLSLA